MTLPLCSMCGEPSDRGQSRCKRCHAAYMREWRKRRPLQGRALQKARARAIVRAALHRGSIERAVCTCGRPAEEAHHHDYDRPLEVTWLCRPCHVEHHKQAPVLP